MTNTLVLTFVLLAVATACTTKSIKTPAALSPCATVDWYEAGRLDGRMGYPLSKLEGHKARCDGKDAPTEHKVDTDLYVNGRESGLIDFCSVTGGLEAGKSGLPYEKVCPEHIESTFLLNYEIGLRIRLLESENGDLEARIDNLVRLLPPGTANATPNSSVRTQIEQLRKLRAQNSNEIENLETRLMDHQTSTQ